MRCLKYEFIKLGKKGIFLVLSLLLLAGNLLAIYLSERMTVEFDLVFEQRENYEAFLDGDASADINDFYSQDLSEQESYIASYPEFIAGMEDRIDQMSVFADDGSYTHRNMLKTKDDFEKFSDVTLKKDNCFGLRAFALSGTGILFLLVFLAVLTYYAIFYERDKNLLLLVKGTRQGRVPTAASKAAAMILSAGIYTAAQESLAVLLFGFLYGYGDTGRMVQSVSEFRNCTYMLTVGEALSAIILIRSVTAMLLACIFFCTAMSVKNETAAAFLSAGIFAAFFFAEKIFSVSGRLDWLVCVNPFYCWDMKSMLGEYRNLNFAGQPVGKDVCLIIVAAVSALILSAAGVLVYSKTCQIWSDSRLEWAVQKFRQRLGFINRRTSLLYYEFYKMLIQQKKIILLALLLIICIRESAAVFGTQYYSSAEAVSYHYYMDQYQGRITDRILNEISEEEAYLDSIAEELTAPDENDAGKFVLEVKLRQNQQGFQRVLLQLETLGQKGGDLYDKYLVDELDYNDLWNDTEGDITRWLVGAVLLILFISGIYTMDEKRKMTGLLRSARLGREKLERSRCICAVLCTVLVYVCMELPVFFEYCRAGLLLTPCCSLLNFTLRSFHTDLALGLFAAAVFILKAAAYGAVCFGGLTVSKMLKNEMPVLLVCSGAVLVIAAVLYRFSMDIEMMLLYIL